LEGGFQVSGFYVFVMRAILGAVFAVVIARTFYPNTNLTYVAGLAIILVGLAYFAEYLRNRRKK
jgi:heme/copper-type cytochrome/quinol oxidase subunit 4